MSLQTTVVTSLRVETVGGTTTTFSDLITVSTNGTSTQTSSSTTFPTDTTPSSSPSPIPEGSRSNIGGFTPAQIGGCVSGIVVLLLIIAILLYFIVRKRRVARRKSQHSDQQTTEDMSFATKEKTATDRVVNDKTE